VRLEKKPEKAAEQGALFEALKAKLLGDEDYQGRAMLKDAPVTQQYWNVKHGTVVRSWS
jgi:hypothetical protein